MELLGDILVAVVWGFFIEKVVLYGIVARFMGEWILKYLKRNDHLPHITQKVDDWQARRKVRLEAIKEHFKKHSRPIEQCYDELCAVL